MPEEDLKNTAVVIYEVDTFVLQERLRTYCIRNCKDFKIDDVSNYCDDILNFLCRFNFVIGFCAFVEEAMSRSILEKLEAMHEAGGPRPRRIHTFNLGNLQGDGRETINPPQFELRDGTSKAEMKAENMKKVKQVLSTGDKAPKCIFIVHGNMD